jgi:hypothetical protein
MARTKVPRPFREMGTPSPTGLLPVQRGVGLNGGAPVGNLLGFLDHGGFARLQSFGDFRVNAQRKTRRVEIAGHLARFEAGRPEASASDCCWWVPAASGLRVGFLTFQREWGGRVWGQQGEKGLCLSIRTLSRPSRFERLRFSVSVRNDRLIRIVERFILLNQ